MNYRAGKSLLRCFKLQHFNTRFLSEIPKTVSSSYYFGRGEVDLISTRIGQVIDNSADKCGDSPAIVSVHQNLTKTYAELRDEAERLASGFISIGLRKGDRLGICSPNCYEWPLTQFAAAKAGLILVNINPASQPRELEYCLKKAGCKALVTWDVLKTQDYYKILCDIIPDLPERKPGTIKSNNVPTLEHIIMITESQKEGTLKLRDVLDSANKESDVQLSEVEKRIQFDDPVKIQFTSGTTGSPKGAVLTHHNVVNNALIFGRRVGYHLEQPVLCCQVPLFHAFGCVSGTLATALFAGTCVLPSVSFDPAASLAATEKHRCTTLFGTPTMYVDLIRQFQAGKFDIASIKQGIIGGSPGNASLTRDIRDILGIPHLIEGYGATETGPAISLTPEEDNFEYVLNGLTKVIQYVEVKIVDSEGRVVPVNAQGEVCARGHNVFLGYWGDEQKTAEVLDKARWYRTGDLGTMSEQGILKIVGRIKDMIIRGGENIYPSEVENFLNTHPDIREVHVCGVPDPRLGEEACAWIRLKEGAQLTEEGLKEFCKGKISHYKIPRYVLFTQQYPKTTTGKVKKFELTKMASEKLKL